MKRMARFGKILLAALSTTLLASSAFAATATIKTASKGVQVGKEGAWKDAVPGMAIAETDFIKIPENATTTVVLPDKTTKDFAGRTVVPGRRLSDKNAAGAMIWFSRGVQAIAGAGETTTAANGIKKDGNEADKLGQKTDRLVFDGASGATHRVSEAVVADVDFSAGHFDQAENAAKLALSDERSTAVDKQLAHLILGQLSASNAAYSDALKEFELAAAMTPEGGRDTEGVRRRALLQRGQSQMQLGDDAAAKKDFEEVAKSSDKVAATQAKFFLGSLALNQHDTKTAKSYFDELKGSNDPLYSTGMAMLEPAK
jgi:hypothetical protein